MIRIARASGEALLVLSAWVGISCNQEPLAVESTGASGSEVGIDGGGANGQGAAATGATTDDNAAVAPADPMAARPRDRLTATINVSDRVILVGHQHPLARPEFEIGPAPSDHVMERMMLVLRPGPEQELALAALLRAQHDPSSALYHRWIEPETYAERFGVSARDVATVAAWLRGHGMVIEEVGKGSRLLLFSGTAAQVEAAFQTPIVTYNIDGETHYANGAEPSIPKALEGVVGAVVSLHDFKSKASYIRSNLSNGENTSYYNGIQQSAIVPQDLATIYNVTPLYAASLDGSGQSIAVLGRSNISLANVRTFRGTYGLPANDPTIVIANKDPGIVCGGDEAEAYLDVEYAGALAKKANIKFVVASSTTSSDGIFLAAQYAVSNKVAPIISLSFGLCEKALGTSGNSFWNSLWQQAAAQGMSVFVASMDSGAAGCDQMNAAVGSGGQAVNGLGSTPFNTAVGGTQFNDVTNRRQYWAASNDPVTQASALGYIPELAWNESRGAGLYATGGGLSTLYAKPSWQFGLGVVPDGKRDVPDLAFAAAIQEPYKIYADNQWFGTAGTSAATPVFASIMALVLQKVGQSQGLVNPTLYSLAYGQTYSAGAAVFHDITQGNNTVPGVSGFAAGPGYDMATGLGSVDANVLVNHWQDATAVTNFQVAAVSPTASVIPGFSTTSAYTLRSGSGFTSAVAFAVNGLPAGVQASFAPVSLKGSGTTTLTLSTSASAAPGTYNLTVVGTSGSISRSVPLSLTVVNAPPLSLAFNPQSLDVAATMSGTSVLTTTRNSTFNAAVALSASGVPQGVSITFSPASIAAPGAGTSTVTASVGANAAGGSYLILVTATGGGQTKTAYLQLNVLPAPSFSLSLGSTALSVAPGSSGNFYATTMRTSAFNSAVTLKVTGLPTGVTASQGTIASPGAGISTLQLTVASTAAGGVYPLTVTATGGGVTRTATLSLSIPGISLTAAGSSLSLKQGGTASIQLTSAMLGGFSSAVSFAVQGLPTGVSATFTPASLAAPGNGGTQMKLAATSSAALGAATLTVKATGGSIVKSVNLNLTVTR